MSEEVKKIKQDKIIPCICLTCGYRNDFSNKNGLCPNNHDDWLEYRDVFLLEDAESKTRNRAKKVFGLTLEELKEKFINLDIKKFIIKSCIEN